MLETVCAGCNKLHKDGVWVEEQPKTDRVTHGVCLPCATEIYKNDFTLSEIKEMFEDTNYV